MKLDILYVWVDIYGLALRQVHRISYCKLIENSLIWGRNPRSRFKDVAFIYSGWIIGTLEGHSSISVSFLSLYFDRGFVDG
jgi:hypothetical protein